MSDITSRSGNGTDTARAESKFVEALTLTDATMLVAGTMIGSGIFIVSADIALSVQTPFWLISVWVLTGIIALLAQLAQLGALAYGGLAAMFPRAGGQYVFPREPMGPLVGFLYGWTLFIFWKPRPDMERPYKAVDYPVFPMLYILLALAVALTLLLADKTRTQSVAGLVIVLVGVPAYYVWRGVAGDTTHSTV